MAGKTAVLAIDIVADASQATAVFDQAGTAASGVADKIDTVGGRAGDTASGLSALSGAMEGLGLGALAEGMNGVAVAMDAAEGASTLFKVAQESLSLVTIKDTAAKIANTVATTAGNVATKLWAATQWLLNAAMSANPIGLIIGLVIGLIAVIVLIATKTTWFQDAWAAAWGAIKTAAAAVWDWLEDAAGTALDAILGPIDAVKAAFDAVVDAIESVINWLKKIKMPKVLEDIGGFIGGILPGGNAAGTGAPGVTSHAMSRATGGGSTTVQVYVPEASDPVATARYLKALIRRGEASGVIFGTV
jgi:hypothetical protein